MDSSIYILSAIIGGVFGLLGVAVTAVYSVLIWRQSHKLESAQFNISDRDGLIASMESLNKGYLDKIKELEKKLHDTEVALSEMKDQISELSLALARYSNENDSLRRELAKTAANRV